MKIDKTQLIRFLDYTSLGQCDTPQSIERIVDDAVSLYERGYDRVASVCVYPSLVESVGLALGDSPIGITAVCGAFPSGQTYIEVKMLEVAMAIENGADEIDIVMNVGAMLQGDEDLVSSEIMTLKEEIGDDALLKVILETGTLDSDELIYRASMVAMNAGADFIKSSTGKTEFGITPEAAATMCRAIKDYFQASGRRIGFKASGGIHTSDQAMIYYDIVGQILGEEWQVPGLFRLGASKLLSNLTDDAK